MTEKLRSFLRQHRLPTPCLVVDLDRVEENYRALSDALPEAAVFYAVKANPAPEVLSRLAALGSSFDVASVPEVDMALATGVGPARISYGNTIKKEVDIAAAFARGVDLFAFDSEAELAKIGRAAPGSRVFCRILTSGAGAEWPLSRKFGCTPEMARELLAKARAHGLHAHGVSFHVGSQQKDPQQWEAALAEVARLFADLDQIGIELEMVNLGGGFPTTYCEAVPDPEAYGATIAASLRRHFGNRIPRLIMEPGRGLVGDAGIIEAEVVLIARKGGEDERRWVYLDIGRFGGLAETMDEAIRYPIACPRAGLTEPAILAGPTCDSADVLYERTPYPLPIDLAIGDRVQIESAGAYTSTYAAVAFNGFAPLAMHCI